MQAKSGMGKTLIFSVALLQQVDTNSTDCQAILIEPTRELAEQNYKTITKLAQYMPNVKIHLAIGGRYYPDDVSALTRGTQILVGTIGRLAHLIREGVLGELKFLLTENMYLKMKNTSDVLFIRIV